MENALTTSTLIDQAVVVGNGEKFAAALLFPNLDALRGWARSHGVRADSDEALLADPTVRAEFERLTARANEGKDAWLQVKRVRLCPEAMSVENGLLTPKMSVKRSDVNKQYADDIAAMYASTAGESAGGVTVVG